ncbi:MAG: fibronectin type III domain-containing protein, partial [Candidatus Thorarchaeota archaeon]
MPIGSNRKLVVSGEDSNQNLLYRGDVTGITVTAGQTTNAGAITLVLVVLSAPVNVSATHGDGEVTISWDGVTDATSYNIYWSTNFGVSKTDYEGKIADITSSSYLLTGLTNGTTYYYVVTAENSYGESDESSEVSATPIAIGTAPSSFTSATATPGDEEVTISWDSVSGATSYNIYWATWSGVSKTDYEGKIPNATSPYAHTGLTNGTTYYYVVTAENSYGESGESSEVSAIPAQNLANGLLAYWTFDNCDATDETGNGYNGTMSGGPVCVDGVFGKALDFDAVNDHIQLQKTVNPNEMKALSFWINSRGVDGVNELGTVIAKYSWGGTRSFLVNSFDAVNDRIGVKLFSDGVTYDGDTLESYYEDPSLLDPDKYTIIDNRELVLNEWNHIVVNITEADVEIWIDGALVSKKSRDYQQYFNSSEPTYIGNTFQIGSDFVYNYRLNGALDDFRIYSRSLSEAEIQELYQPTPGTPPSAPTNVSATAGDEEVTISWDSVSGATSYNIYWATWSGVSKTDYEGNIPNATSPYAHTGRTNGITYYYVVTAANSYGESGESSEVFATPIGIPSITTSPATSVTSGSATLNGTVNPNGASTACYFEYGTTTSYGSTTTSASAGSGTTAVSVSDGIIGLNPNTTYHFRIVATNSAGTSNGLDQTFTTEINPPTNVRAYPGDEKVTIFWDDVLGATSYNIYWATWSGVSRTDYEGKIEDITSTSYIHEGLVNDTTYYYVVTAENSYGESDESDEVYAKPGIVIFSDDFESG